MVPANRDPTDTLSVGADKAPLGVDSGVFLLFSVFGFYVDRMSRGVLPYVVVLQIALYVGLNASLWIIVLSRLSMPFLAGLIVLQFFNAQINTSLANWSVRSFHLKPVPSDVGIHFAATATMSAIILSYVFFVVYIRREGRESFRLRNELELAHGIQKTLVPPVGLRTVALEIYGISHPSEFPAAGPGAMSPSGGKTAFLDTMSMRKRSKLT